MGPKATQAGRLRGPGAAGGADPGTTNTPAAETAESAVVAEGAAPAAPEGSSQFDATHAPDEGGTPPVGGEAIVGSVEQTNAEPVPGYPVAGFFWSVPRLRVRAIDPLGFRRAGRFWSHEGDEIAADELTPDQILALLGEPQLVVTQIADELDE